MIVLSPNFEASHGLLMICQLDSELKHPYVGALVRRAVIVFSILFWFSVIFGTTVLVCLSGENGFPALQ